MSNLSTLEMRESVVNWYNNLSNEKKIELIKEYLKQIDGIKFVDEILTPVYCKLNKIILE